MLRRWRRRKDEIVCIQFVEVVTDYLEGSMTHDERARFEAHLAACPGCTRYLAQIRTTVALAGRLTVDDVDAMGPSARDELLAAFRSYRS
ncbi:MAG: anti-sigma factor family protein [Acidimicrobiia bacterium]